MSFKCHLLSPSRARRLQAAPQSLHDAAKGGNQEELKRLIEEGKDVNEKDRRGITALGVAVGFNRTPCIRALLDAGADVHLTDARGSTVLHYAAGMPPPYTPLLRHNMEPSFHLVGVHVSMIETCSSWV